MLLTKEYCKFLGILISAGSFIILVTGLSVADEISETVHVTTTASQVKTEPAASPPAIQLTTPDRINSEYFAGYISDTGRMLVAPLEWNGSDWLKAGVVAGAASGLYIADTDIRRFAQRNQSSAGDIGATIGNVLGNPLFAVPSLGLFYLYGQINEDPKARRASLLAVESLAISGAFTMTVKLVTQRPRPYTGESSTTFGGPSIRTIDSAFPSIHTQTAFSIASVLAEEYGTNTYVPPIAYGLAALVGLSRIYDDQHWTSDVFLGGAIGYAVGKAVVRYHTAQNDTSLTILPTVTRQGFTLMAKYRF